MAIPRPSRFSNTNTIPTDKTSSVCLIILSIFESTLMYTPSHLATRHSSSAFQHDSGLNMFGHPCRKLKVVLWEKPDMRGTQSSLGVHQISSLFMSVDDKCLKQCHADLWGSSLLLGVRSHQINLKLPWNCLFQLFQLSFAVPAKNSSRVIVRSS